MDNRQEDPPKHAANRVYVECNDDEQLIFPKRFLASESGYFRSIFFSHFSDSQHEVHRVPFDSNLTAETILAAEKAVHKQVPIWNLSQACSLLTPATYFQLDRLLPLIRKSIISQAEIGNLLKIFRHAYQRDVPLAEHLWKIVLRHFNKLVETKEYLNMTDEELVKAMKNETLNIESKKEIYAIQQYLHHHPDSPQTREICFRYTGDGVDNPVVMDRVPGDVLVALGGWSNHGPMDLVEIYNPRRNIWIRAPMLEDARVAYHSLLQNENSLFCAGGMNGQEYFRTIKRFDLNDKTWRIVGEMSEQRCYVSSAWFSLADGSQRMMLMGGFNGRERLSSCELATPKMEWTKVRSMNRGRSDAAAVTLNGNVYIVGGFDGRHVHQDVETYDAATNKWTLLGRRMQHARTGVCAVALNKNVMLIAGGFNGSARLSTVEFYDTREGKFHSLPKMLTTRSNFGLEQLNGEIYAIGGFDGLSTTSSTEKFDMVAQQWTKLPDLTISRSALKMVRLSDHNIISQLVNFTSEM